MLKIVRFLARADRFHVQGLLAARQYFGRDLKAEREIRETITDLWRSAAARASLDLPGRQLELAKALHATGRPVIVVLMNGRPLAINRIAENAPAILETWFAGTQAGHAIADVLFGDVNPGGKLPVTFPRAVGQVPLYYNHKNTGRPPDVKNRYTSKYYDAPWTPLYPFGYGLSYTQFRLSNLQLSGRQISPGGRLTASVEVENIGKRSGDEVVQLYLRDIAASVTRPVKELKGFQRIERRSKNASQPGREKRNEHKPSLEGADNQKGCSEHVFIFRANWVVTQPVDVEGRRDRCRSTPSRVEISQGRSFRR